MNDARVTSIVIEVIRTAQVASGAGSSAGVATVEGKSPNNGRQPVVCIITN